MAALLIKNIPVSLHERLKELALKQHRSMAREVVVLLEEAIERFADLQAFGSAVKGQFPLTEEFLNEAKRKGRQ